MALTKIGSVEVEVPRNLNSTFEPQIVKKRQRRLSRIDEIVLSLTAKGLTTGETAAHFAEIDAISVKVRHGQVANRPFYVATGVTCAGERDILELWAVAAAKDMEEHRFVSRIGAAA
jgi:putative transposase